MIWMHRSTIPFRLTILQKLTGVNALDSGYANYLRKTIENLENRMFWVPLGNDQYKTMSWVNRGSIVDMKKKDDQHAL